MVAAVILKALLAKANAFTDVNACVAECVRIAAGSASSPPTAEVCSSCVCLCGRTLNLLSVGFHAACQHLLSVGRCDASASCPATCS